MNPILRVCLALLLVSICVAPAFAAGTPQQRRACRADAFRLCRQYIPWERPVKACMIANFSKLSPLCRAQFRSSRT